MIGVPLPTSTKHTNCAKSDNGNYDEGSKPHANANGRDNDRSCRCGCRRLLTQSRTFDSFSISTCRGRWLINTMIWIPRFSPSDSSSVSGPLLSIQRNQGLLCIQRSSGFTLVGILPSTRLSERLCTVIMIRRTGMLSGPVSSCER